MKLLWDDQLLSGSQPQCENMILFTDIESHRLPAAPSLSTLSHTSLPIHLPVFHPLPLLLKKSQFRRDTLPCALLTTANIINMASYQFLDLAHAILTAKNPPLSRFHLSVIKPFNIQLALQPLGGALSRQHPMWTPCYWNHLVMIAFIFVFVLSFPN